MLLSVLLCVGFASDRTKFVPAEALFSVRLDLRYGFSDGGGFGTVCHAISVLGGIERCVANSATRHTVLDDYRGFESAAVVIYCWYVL